MKLKSFTPSNSNFTSTILLLKEYLIFLSITNNMEDSLETFERTIRSTILGQLRKNITHNHKPVRFIVKGCPYCKEYGNIFCTKVE